MFFFCTVLLYALIIPYMYIIIYICDLTGETSCHESLPSFEGANAKCLGRIERLR